MEPLSANDPTRVGRYRLTHLLGAGGMGKVYLGRTDSGRKIVVKVIRADCVRQTEYRARFTREVAAARRVGGFHTAQVVDANTTADEPWIASAYIPGPSLQQAVTAHGPLTEDTLHLLAVGLAEGLGAIHEHGLVHRDLKPANIILADDGPRVIDFGVAHPVEDTRITHTGALLGTPAYMAPEQAEGRSWKPAVDVFSLGTVLHFAATGTNPFQAHTIMATLRALIGPTPTVPNEVPRALRNLITRCWNQDPNKRPTLKDVVSVLGPVDSDQNRPAFRRPARSHGSEETLRDPRGNNYHFLSSTEKIARKPSSKYWNSAKPNLITFRGHWGLVGSATFSPNGTTIATASSDRTARLWNTKSGKQIMSLRHSDGVTSAAFNPAGTRIATTSYDSMAYLWDTITGEIIIPLSGHKGWVESVAFSPDGALLATAGEDKTTRIWDAKTGERVDTLFGHYKGVEAVTFSPNGELIATASSDKTVRVWDAHRRVFLFSLQHEFSLNSARFNQDASILATTSGDEAHLWHTHTQTKLLTLEHSTWANFAAFSPDETLLATACSDNNVHLWDIERKSHLGQLKGSTELVTSVEFSPDGTSICGSSHDHTGLLWRAS